MNRAEKIRKLVNAVKEWRGAFSARTGKWTHHPRPTARSRVENWVSALGLPVEPTMSALASFTKYADFTAWLQTL